MLQSFLSGDGFRVSNISADDVGSNFYVLDIRYQQIFTGYQPIKKDFQFDGVVTNGVNADALVLTNKLEIKSSVGQRHFDSN